MFKKLFETSSILDFSSKEEELLRDTRIYSIYPSNLDLLSAYSELQKYFDDIGFKEEPNSRCSNNAHRIEIDDKQFFQVRNYSGVLKILNKHPHPKKVHIHSHWKHKKNKNECAKQS